MFYLIQKYSPKISQEIFKSSPSLTSINTGGCVKILQPSIFSSVESFNLFKASLVSSDWLETSATSFIVCKLEGGTSIFRKGDKQRLGDLGGSRLLVGDLILLFA